MIIKKVEISNILGIQSASLSFDENHSAFLVQSVPDCAIQSAFSTAVQLIVSSKYASIESLTSLENIHSGFVRITLVMAAPEYEYDNVADSNEELECTPCTSHQAVYYQQRVRDERQNKQFSQIVACRNFAINPIEIQLSVDNKPCEFYSPTTFQARFRTNIDYVIPYLDKSGHVKSGNLLDWIFKNLNDKRNHDQQLLQEYTRNCSPFNAGRDSSAFLRKLTTCFLNALTVYSVEQKCSLMKLCNDIRTIFEFLTYDEYTVWFFIPHQGNFKDIKEITIEELDLNAINTYIQLKNENFSDLIPWLSMDQVLKDLLTISFDLALGFMCKYVIIFIHGIEGIQEHQTVELGTAKYLRKIGVDISEISKDKNYLQRIVDVCNTMKISAIIEFSAEILFPPINVNVIKCFKDTDQIWKMSVVNTNPTNGESAADRI